jgi:hypothetical protein
VAVVAARAALPLVGDEHVRQLAAEKLLIEVVKGGLQAAILARRDRSQVNTFGPADPILVMVVLLGCE